MGIIIGVTFGCTIYIGFTGSEEILEAAEFCKSDWEEMVWFEIVYKVLKGLWVYREAEGSVFNRFKSFAIGGGFINDN